MWLYLTKKKIPEFAFSIVITNEKRVDKINTPAIKYKDKKPSKERLTNHKEGEMLTLRKTS